MAIETSVLVLHDVETGCCEVLTIALTGDDKDTISKRALKPAESHSGMHRQGISWYQGNVT